MRTLPLLFSLMMGVVLVGMPTVGLGQLPPMPPMPPGPPLPPPPMLVGASATDTLAISNPLVPFGVAINTTGTVQVHAGTTPLRYSRTFTYFMGGMLAPVSIKPAGVANLPANGTITGSLVDSFIPPFRGQGEVVIEVLDDVTGRVLTQTRRRFDVQ